MAIAIYLLFFNEGTLRIKTKASFDNTTAESIQRGGIIVDYDSETNILFFLTAQPAKKMTLLLMKTQ